MTYIYRKNDVSLTTSQFTEKARAYFAPKPRPSLVKSAFAKIVCHVGDEIEDKTTEKVVPFLYLNGKSREWLDIGQELFELGCLDELHDILTDYLRFLHGTSPTIYNQTVDKLRKLDKCWNSVEGWKQVAVMQTETDEKKGKVISSIVMSFHTNIPSELALLSRDDINTLILSGVSVEHVHQATDQYTRTRLTLVGRKDPLDAVARELDNHKHLLRYINHDMRSGRSVNNFTSSGEPALTPVQTTKNSAGLIYLPLKTPDGVTLQEPYSLLISHPTTGELGIALEATYKAGFGQPYYLPKAKATVSDNFLSLTHLETESITSHGGAEAVLEIFHLMKSEKLTIRSIVEVVTEGLAEKVRLEYNNLVATKLLSENWIYGRAVDTEAAGTNALTRPVLFLTLPTQQASRFLPLIAYLQHAEQAIKGDDDIHPPFQYQLYDKVNQIVAGNSARFDVTPVAENRLLSALPGLRDPFPYMLKLPNGTTGISFQFHDVLPDKGNDRFMQISSDEKLFQTMQQLTTESSLPAGQAVSLKIFCMDNLHGLNHLKQLVVNGLRCEGRNVWERYRCGPLAAETTSILSLKDAYRLSPPQQPSSKPVATTSPASISNSAPARSKLAPSPLGTPVTNPVTRQQEQKKTNTNVQVTSSEYSAASKIAAPIASVLAAPPPPPAPVAIMHKPLGKPPVTNPVTRQQEQKKTNTNVKVKPIEYSAAASKIAAPIAAVLAAPPPPPAPVAIMHKEEKRNLKARQDLEKTRLEHEAKKAAKQIEEQRQAQIAAAAKMKRAIEREAEVKRAQLAEAKRQELQALKRQQAHETAKLEANQKQGEALEKVLAETNRPQLSNAQPTTQTTTPGLHPLGTNSQRSQRRRISRRMSSSRRRGSRSRMRKRTTRRKSSRTRRSR